jgi:hypothetical protein
MKLLKTLTLCALAIVLIGHASAQTVIYGVGSTAFRTGVTAAIIDYLAGGTAANGDTTTGGTVYAAFSNDKNNIFACNQSIIANGTIGTGIGTGGSATIVFDLFWTGSSAGCVDVTTQSSTATFFNPSNSTVYTALNSSQIDPATDLFESSPETPDNKGAASITVTGTTANHTGVDFAMSDVNKYSISSEIATATVYTQIGIYNTVSRLATGITSKCVDAGTSSYAGGLGHVAICPFEWVVGNMGSYQGSSAPVIPTAMTQNIAKGLVSNGAVTQGIFTGTNNASDSTTQFFCVGRNEDSGTRICTFSEAQFNPTGAPLQYQLSGSGSTLSAVLFPASTTLYTQPNIGWNLAGHSGYNTGSNVASALETADTGTVSGLTGGSGPTNAYFIGGLGLTDAANALNAGASKALTYNGYAYSAAAVQQGQYTLWSYEHLYKYSSTSNGAAIDAVADLVATYDADAIFVAIPDNATGVSETNGLVAGINHAENQSTGVYTTGSATYTSSGTTSTVQEAYPGLFDDTFVHVSRSATAEGTPVVFGNTATAGGIH